MENILGDVTGLTVLETLQIDPVWVAGAAILIVAYGILRVVEQVKNV